MVLSVQSLDSGYRSTTVLKNINFDMQAGEIVGLIGLNGAGKSTLLKTILGLITPQKGQIVIDGKTILDGHTQYAKHLAYIPETPVLYDELTLKDHLEMTALGYGIPFDEVMRRAQPLLKLFRLDNHLNWFPAYFSKGMKQKVMIICAFITDANVLIIDEPFLGLDPLAMRHFTDLIRERAAAGSTVLFTTHVLTIAESLCDYYLMLQAGELVATGTLEELQDQFQLPQADLETIYFAMTQTGGLVSE